MCELCHTILQLYVYVSHTDVNMYIKCYWTEKFIVSFMHKIQYNIAHRINKYTINNNTVTHIHIWNNLRYKILIFMYLTQTHNI